MIGLRHDEFRNGGIEAKLNTLEQHWMVDTPGGEPPGEDPVAKHQLETLSLALKSSVEFIELFEHSHGGPAQALIMSPFIPFGFPIEKGSYPFRILVKPDHGRLGGSNWRRIL